MTGRFVSSRKDRAGIFLIAATVLAVSAIGVLAYRMRPPTLDPESLCLSNAPIQEGVAILSDSTDKLSSRHRKRLHRAVETEAHALPKHARLMLFSLDARSPREPKLLFSKCSPGRGGDVNPLFDNPKRVDRLFDQQFLTPLLEQTEKAGASREARASPILESLWAVSTDPDFVGERRELLIVSDLLQNSPEGVSFYNASPEALTRNQRAAPELDLRGVEVRLVVLDRPEHAEAQKAAIESFWRPLLVEAGAEGVVVQH